MFRKFALITLAAMGVSAGMQAQVLRPCATDEVYRRLVQEHPEIQQYEDQMEAQLHAGLNNGKLNRFAKTSAVGPDTTTYDIPLVIHVIHDYGAENLSDTLLYDAVNYWAQVYLKENADTIGVIDPFIPYIGNPKIRLHLATIDPSGKPTKGITRHQSYLTSAADDQAKLDQWPPNEYVNIWFVNTFGAEDVGAAAYAYLPASGEALPYYDGVIGLATYANYAKAIPHEIGHVLNLQHPWGNTNSPDVACGDDHVDDTPPTKGHNPSGCVPSALYDTTCATGYMKTYTAVGGEDSVVNYPDTANSQNIMDYTYCQEMFTIGQTERMRTALTGPTAGRNNLITPANLALTGALAPFPDLAPIADFSVERGIGGVVLERSYYMSLSSATNFQFHNRSWNDTVSDVFWTFSNGATTPTSTSMFAVQNKFSQTGWVTVTLVANSNAGSDTEVSQPVYVADTVALPIGSVQNFSTAADVANWPMFNFYNNQFKWEYYTSGGFDDGSCIRYRSFDGRSSPANMTGTPVGDHDDIYTPAYDLSGSTTGDINLDFYTAGASNSGFTPGFGLTTKGDSMEVDVSINGGARWAKIGDFNAAQLDNNTARSTEFLATSVATWAARTVSVPTTYRNKNTFFRLRYWPGNNGNNLYVDKISISQFSTEVNQVMATPDAIKIYPNPAKDGCNIVFRSGVSGNASIIIKDITGKLVYSEAHAYAPNSGSQQFIPRSVTPVAGMYFVTVTIDGTSSTEKLIVY